MADLIGAADMLPSVTRLKGAETYSLTQKVDDSCESLTLRVWRDDLPDIEGDVLACLAELSLDGGATWSENAQGAKAWPYGVFPFGFTAAGGKSVAPDGSPLDISEMTMPLPKTTGRIVRVRLTAIESLKCRVEIEAK